MNRSSNAVRQTEEVQKRRTIKRVIKLKKMKFENYRKRIFACAILLVSLFALSGLLSLFLFFRAKSHENLHRKDILEKTYKSDHLMNQELHKDSNDLVTAYAVNDKAVLI